MLRGLLRLRPSACCSVLMGKSNRFYGVRVGYQPGVYYNWQDCEAQVHGFSNARFKSFRTYDEAEEFVHDGGGPQVALHSSSGVHKKQQRRQEQGAWQLAGSMLDFPPYAHQQTYSTESEELQESQESQDLPPEVDPEECYRLEFDGGARPNPGPAGAGAVLLHDATGEEVRLPTKITLQVGRVCVALEYATNNVAEYMGLITGLQAANALGVQFLQIYGDSKLVVNQVQGRWQVRSDGLAPLHAEAVSLLRGLAQYTIAHIPREDNGTADLLSNMAIDGDDWEGLQDTAGRIWDLQDLPYGNEF